MQKEEILTPIKNVQAKNGPSHQTNLDLSLKHLQAELGRVDVLLHREIHRWRLANQDPSDSFRGFYVSHQDAETLLNRGFGRSWGQTVTITPQEEQMYLQAQTRAKKIITSLTSQAQKQNQILRLNHLVNAFGLDQFELDTLLIALAPTLDLRYEQIFGYLQDHVAKKRPTVNLVLNLLGEPGPRRLILLAYFNDEARLFKNEILRCVGEPGQADPPLLSQNLVVDKTIVSWLWGDYQPHPDFAAHANLAWPRGDDLSVLLPLKIQQSLQSITKDNNPVVIFHGQDYGSQEAAARYVALQLGQPLLTVDLKAIINSQLSPLEALRFAFRDARLIGAVPCFFGWDVCLEDDKTPPYLLTELCSFPGIAIVAGQKWWQASHADRDRLLFWQNFPMPDYVQRRNLWKYYLSSRASEETENVEQVVEQTKRLADQFYLTTGQIRDAVMSAKDMSVQFNSNITIDDLFASARTHSSSRLATLAKKIEARFEWADIILPQDQVNMLREAVNMVVTRTTVLKEWGLGDKLASSQGVTMLFAGPPGTGKTMGAEVIAGELGLDLYKIDLSTLVSKYIGETEKNLEKIFKEAESSNAILFFDEADSLFGKRSEVKDSHDRYANIEVSYLLQRMETYDGITIMATNLRANLDEAFTRRLQFAINFPFPDEEDRRRIWRSLFPEDVPCAPEVDLNVMAKRFKLAGGNIRNIIVGAAYLAASDGGSVTMAHLMHSTGRELQKMGRLVRNVDMLPHTPIARN